ncbi:MAG: M56 family metallopeptidase [Gemmatimonadaceae bacterium]|nr:M56 family metallopeptidase [Gemmatimonadaceae bacterium]
MDASWPILFAGVGGSGAVVAGAWLLTYALHSTVLLLSAWVVTSIRWLGWSPAARQTMWRVALVAGVLTSAAQVAAPALARGRVLRLTDAARGSVAALQVVQRSSASSAAAASASRGSGERSAQAVTLLSAFVGGLDGSAVGVMDGSAVGVMDGSAVGVMDGSALRVMVFSISRAAVVVAVWGIVALVLVARMALGQRRLMPMLDGRRVASTSLAAGALRQLAALAGVRRPVALSTSDALRAPAAISSREIVLPSRALRDLSLAEQEGVLAHELAHVVRHDTRWLQLAALLERLAWFQPLNRVARRQMQLEGEFAADAWAVQLTRQPLALARALSRVAEWVAAQPAGARYHAAGATLAARADGSPLVERVRRLTAPSRDRARHQRLGGRWGVGIMASAASLALVFLPRIEAGNSERHATTFRTNERLELRLAATPRHTVTRVVDMGTRWSGTRVRLVRVGQSAFRLAPPTTPHLVPRRILVIARQVS